MNYDSRVLKSKVSTSRVQQQTQYNLDGLAKFQNSGGSKTVNQIYMILLFSIIKLNKIKYV